MHKDLGFYVDAIHCATNYLPTTLEQLIAEYCILLEWERLVRDLKLGGENFIGIYKPNISIYFNISQHRCRVFEPKLTQIYVQPIKCDVFINRYRNYNDYKGFMSYHKTKPVKDKIKGHPYIFGNCGPNWTNTLWAGHNSLPWKYNITGIGPGIEIFLTEVIINYGVCPVNTNDSFTLSLSENNEIFCVEFLSSDYVIQGNSIVKYIPMYYSKRPQLKKINIEEWKTKLFSRRISISCSEF